MNKLFKLSVVLVFGLLGFNAAYADGPGWTAVSKVVKIVVTFNGGINVQLSPNLSGCVSQSGYGPLFASLYPDHPGIDRIQSTLMLAYVSDKPVMLYLTDNSCKIGEVMLGGE